MSRSGLMLGLLGTIAIGMPAGSATAQEYCVTCTSPNAIYRCVIDNAKPGGAQSLQMFCISNMAKLGGHATCALKGGTVFACDGPVKHVPWVSSDNSGHGSEAATAKVEPDLKAKLEPDPKEPPKTLLEMAKRSNEQTAEQMKKAAGNVKDGVQSTGDAIGKASKKTWECVTTLFKQC